MQRGQSVFMRWKDDFAWSRWLSRISSIMSSHDLSTRPSAVVYCHRASSRVMPKRLLEMWSIPHAHAVPLIVCLTDVCGVDDAALKEVRRTMAGLVKSLGPDAVNRTAQLIEINSEHKTVRGHQYKYAARCMSRANEKPTFMSSKMLALLVPRQRLAVLSPPWSFRGCFDVHHHTDHAHLCNLSIHT